MDTVDVGPDIVIAYLEAFPADSVIRFTYGDGTVRTQNGAVAQPNIGLAEFTIQTDGDGDGDFAEVRGTERTAAEKDKTPKPLGAVYRDAMGVLRVDVTGADDGSGTAEVAIVDTEQGEGSYPDTDDSDGDGDRTEVLDDLMRIHAGDKDTYLKFTYTPSETIEDGQLRFTVHNDWSDPQDTPGTDGYTYFNQGGTNTDIGPASFDENSQSATVDIFYIDTNGSIEIHYGAFDIKGDGSGAHAPTAASTSSPFTIDIKGGDDAISNRFSAIKTAKLKPIAVRVLPQASGGGSAAVTDGADDLTAGGMDAEITIVYTAAGEINNGMLKLTIPAKWSAPMTGAMGNVAVTSTGNTGAMDAGGNYGEDDTLPEGLGAMDVNVAGVSLDADDTVTFTYSNVTVQPTVGDDAAFVVKVNGGAGPGEDAESVSADPEGALTVSVGEAAPGSGSGMVEGAPAVTVNSPENTLIFIYTADGQINSRKNDFRVKVPTGWSEPTAETTDTARGSYTVTQKRLDGEVLQGLTAAEATVEKFGPFGMELAARLKLGESVLAGDQIIFRYENADAPTAIGPSIFEMYFGGVEVKRDTDLSVVVGSGKDATALVVNVSADMILVEDDESVTVTVELKDEDGNAVLTAEDLEVGLVSSNADTGSFMVDGEAEEMVTIMAGTSSAMADYTDSTVGEATITASSGTLTDGTATVTVTTDVVEITSATFSIADSDGVAREIGAG